MKWAKLVLRFLFAAVTTPVAFVLGMCTRRRGAEGLIWGPAPLINNKYWSQAMNEAGWDSITLMSSYSWINTREDFDLYFEDLIPRCIKSARLRHQLAPVVALSYIIRNAAVVHPSFLGGPLGQTPLWRLEAYLLKWAGIRTVVQPFGGDVYMYSQIMDPAVRNALLISYPAAARQEREIAARVHYWTRHADIIVGGFIVDGLGRWDVLAGNFVCVDTTQWLAKTRYFGNDGLSGCVKIMHAPNHRGIKGTEYVIDAVEQLKAEGLQIELILLERVPNERVRELMQEVDILADQFVLPGYGLNAIEGMSSGLPVMCNMDDEVYTRVFRRYSFLNECPIVSTSVESIKRNLKALILNPGLREELGRAGRQYAEKYHSYAAAQYLFGSIYDKILRGKDVDLMNLFHPLISEYNRRTPHVNHPLIDNHLPPEYFSTTSPHDLKSAWATTDR
jgi:glycosyltransferase involved in cell wall biosynthesis